MFWSFILEQTWTIGYFDIGVSLFFKFVIFGMWDDPFVVEYRRPAQSKPKIIQNYPKLWDLMTKWGCHHLEFVSTSATFECVVYYLVDRANMRDS